MKIKIRESNGIYILDLEGNIDINASNFVESVGWVLINKSKDILCNFSDVNLVDYVGISIIAVAYKNVLNHNGRMKFYNVPSHVQKIFSIVGLDKVLESYATEEQAINSFAEEKIMSQIMKKKLRRRFKRVPSNIIIEYKPKFSVKDMFFKGKIVNLSADGVFIFTKHLFSIGDLLTVRIYILPKPGVLELDAKVIWAADKQLQPHVSPGMGLEFYNITPEMQEKIMKFVEKHLTRSAQDNR